MATDKAIGAWVAEHVVDRAALSFLGDVYCIIELWDDLIDADRAPDASEVNEAFYAALVTLPANPFYRAHVEALGAALVTCILSWHTANALHGGSVEANAQAYALRKGFINLVGLCVAILRGPEAGKLACIAGWSASALDDPYTDFVKEKTP